MRLTVKYTDSNNPVITEKEWAIRGRSGKNTSSDLGQLAYADG